MFEIFIICRKRKFSKSLIWQGIQLSDHIGTSTSVGLLWKRKRKEEIIFSKHFPVRSKISYPEVVNLLVYSLTPLHNICLSTVHVHCCIYLKTLSFPIWNLIWPITYSLDWHGYHFVSLSFSAYQHLLSGIWNDAEDGVSKFTLLPFLTFRPFKLLSGAWLTICVIPYATHVPSIYFIFCCCLRHLLILSLRNSDLQC